MLVNLDLGIVAVPGPKPMYDPKYMLLSQRVVAKFTDEVAIYKHSGIFPARRIRTVLWELIAGVMAIAAGMTAPGNMTIWDVAQMLSAGRLRSDAPVGSYQRLVLDGMLVAHFADQLTTGFQQLKGSGNAGFATIYDGMQDFFVAMHKAKK
jgi:hypothetical protein